MNDSLRYLADAYFHEDYDLVVETPIEAIKKFRATESLEDVDSLRLEIRTILAMGKTEDELADVWLKDMRAHYDPRNDQIQPSAWFDVILKNLG